VGICGPLIGDRSRWPAAVERDLPVRRDVGVRGAAMVEAGGS
jgi:hypothetical protein